MTFAIIHIFVNNPPGGLFPKKLQIWALLEVKDLLEGYNIKGVYFLKNIYSDLEKMQLKKKN